MNIRGNEQNLYWSNRANTYGHQYGLDRESVQLKIKRKVELMGRYLSFNGEKIIEFGCGTGLYTKEFARMNPKILATDISINMLKVANKYCPKVSFCQIDSRETMLTNNSYDVVLSAFLLQHVEIELVLPEMYRIMKKGGYLGAFVPNIVNPLHYSRARIGFMRKILRENSQSVDYDRWEWKRILYKYGLDEICIKPIEFTSPYIPSRLIPLGSRISGILENIPFIKEYAGTLLIVARK